MTKDYLSKSKMVLIDCVLNASNPIYLYSYEDVFKGKMFFRTLFHTSVMGEQGTTD